MKHILITGKSSYIGNQVVGWLDQSPGKYKIDKISVRDDSWKNIDFSHYDTILHLAGIAHVSRDPKMESLYYKVNRDLTVEIAKKAKSQGVKQFIFMSSIIVYGNNNGEKKVINKSTIPNPINFYGRSKIEAEEGIRHLSEKNFRVVILRPPMIYGENSKGNYSKLAKLAKIVKVFPDIENKRSMLYIDNLCELIRLIIDNNDSGLFFPQNSTYVKTSEMVRLIGEAHGNNIILTKIFNPIIRILVSRMVILDKLFGNLVYEQQLSIYKSEYRLTAFKESIKLTERKVNKN